MKISLPLSGDGAPKLSQAKRNIAFRPSVERVDCFSTPSRRSSPSFLSHREVARSGVGHDWKLPLRDHEEDVTYDVTFRIPSQTVNEDSNMVALLQVSSSTGVDLDGDEEVEWKTVPARNWDFKHARQANDEHANSPFSMKDFSESKSSGNGPGRTSSTKKKCTKSSYRASQSRRAMQGHPSVRCDDRNILRAGQPRKFSGFQQASLKTPPAGPTSKKSKPGSHERWLQQKAHSEKKC